ncbi:glycoside hydrolase family 16 protein [Sphingobium phenoxybenzoativorans]|uniref:Glycoside hydrolase family 16 protein n=1 Tax=Sphingobium phenoxybenzoativorans TaxID=1592790 RepID=A0A975K770_9SPHN|nr:glycoside hydrolase family 16 protein [Sphingobium phenoxybenzoativorans]QUT05644.1 glycoside hydrolase family 16 protein [Sphingobium phenoxybenzoativorans]
MVSRLFAYAAALGAAIFPLTTTAGSWVETLKGRALDVWGVPVHQQEFNTNSPLSLEGMTLWAKQRADYGLSKFSKSSDTAAYVQEGGYLKLRAYKDNLGVIRSGHVQSVTINQSGSGYPINPGINGYTCTGCYWEARVRFPNDAYGTWGGFWLLSPDNPAKRGHLEVDVIEYYGFGDRRGHHHAWHRWETAANGGHKANSNYIGIDALGDRNWHTYGADLRGKATVDGKPAIVLFFDGKEISRYPVDQDFFTTPFYYNFTLAVNPNDKKWTLPQAMLIDWVRVYK